MHHFLREWLCCPACHADLAWTITEADAERIHAATMHCAACGAEYAVRDDIALLLTPDLPRDDLWSAADSRLNQVLRADPDLEATMRRSTNPADQFLLSMVLEERGDFATAQTLFDQAFHHLYTPAYMTGQTLQMTYVCEQVTAGPVLDLASGRGYLVEELLNCGVAPIVATDFSPRILRRNRDYFQHKGLYSALSLVACDARRLPFKPHTIPTMTSFLGLSNIAEPQTVIAELKRVLAGRLWAVCQFYAADDTPNIEIIRRHNMLLVEDELFAQFTALDWPARLAERYQAQVSPTLQSEALGISIDGLPVTATLMTWGTIVA